MHQQKSGQTCQLDKSQGTLNLLFNRFSNLDSKDLICAIKSDLTKTEFNSSGEQFNEF